MPGNAVHLDALIRREDFEGGTEVPRAGEFHQIKAAEVEAGVGLFTLFRKPDFQRETSNWTPKQVADLIQGFIEEDFIPSLILWRSAINYNFVIDGAHRLSSLMAWVNNDYGAGTISEQFWRGKDRIPPSVKKIAAETKELVDDRIGPYESIKKALSTDTSLERYREMCARLPHCHLRVQWLPQTDAGKAERSFFKINEQGVALTETEKTLGHSRNCPNAVSARAISQRGTGHPYWKKFADDKKKQIEQLAEDLHDRLFLPTISGSAKTTRDRPIAGNPELSGSLAMLLNMVNLTNHIEHSIPQTKEEAEKLVASDVDGNATIALMKQTNRIATRISNRLPSESSTVDTDLMRCLDLHPHVYVYSETDRHLPSSLLAVVELVTEFETKDYFQRFTLIRKEFEEFLLANRDFIQQLGRSKRGQLGAVHLVKKYFLFVITCLEEGQSSAKIIQSLGKSVEFSFLKPTSTGSIVPVDATPVVKKRGFPKSVRSKAFVSIVLNDAIRCAVCGARIPDRGISYGHIEKRESGGANTGDNLATEHHYCNSAKDVLTPLFTKKDMNSVAART